MSLDSRRPRAFSAGGYGAPPPNGPGVSRDFTAPRSRASSDLPRGDADEEGSLDNEINNSSSAVRDDHSARERTQHRRGSSSARLPRGSGGPRPGIESRLGRKYSTSSSTGSSTRSSSSSNEGSFRYASHAGCRGGTGKRQVAYQSSHLAVDHRRHDPTSLRHSVSASSLPQNQQQNHQHSNINKKKSFRNRSSSAVPYSERVPETGFCVKISGFSTTNTNTTLLLGFLRRASEKSLTIVRHILDTQSLFIEISSESELEALLKLHGALYGNEMLSVTRNTGIAIFESIERKDGAPRAIEHLKLIIRERYDPEKGILDLSNIASDARLVSSGFSLSKSHKARTFIATFLKDNNMDPLHLSLAGNALSDLSGWGRFFEGFSKLQSLSLSCNQFEDMAGLRLLRAEIFPELVAIDLKDNPLASGPIERYRKALMEKLPKLANLNGVQCPIVMFAIGGSAAAPDEMPVCLDLYDSEQTRQLAMSFLGAFFYALDNDIEQLRSVYHSEALFSISLAITKGFSEYQAENRNLKNIRKQDERFKKLVSGASGIVYALQNLPKSDHDKKSMVVDAWSSSNIVPGGVPTVHIHIHGELKSKMVGRSDSVRAFDRTLVLIITNPEVAQIGGQIQCQIIHDMLCLRNRGSGKAPWLNIVQQPQLVVAQNPNSAPLAIPAPFKTISQVDGAAIAPIEPSLAGTIGEPIPGSLLLPPGVYPPKPTEMSDDAYKLILRAMGECGLTWDGAILCLHKTGGDLQQIVVAKAQNQIERSLLRG